MKGIILAGGKGSRLYPITVGTCKQLLPIYDKPMIFYPLSVLMLAGIQEILIISTEEDLPRFQRIFGDGSFLGVSIEYAVQQEPRGIAEAFLVGSSFIGDDPVALILGDNIFYGDQMEEDLVKASSLQKGGIVFAYEVKDPHRYGVVAWNDRGGVADILEKPLNPPSCHAVTGLYFYDREVVSLAKKLKPSQRGELEITDLNRLYLEKGALEVIPLGRGTAWLDTGTYEALMQASLYVQAVQERQGIKIACLEEIAYSKGWITQRELEERISTIPSEEYRNYLKRLLCLNHKFRGLKENRSLLSLT